MVWYQTDPAVHGSSTFHDKVCRDATARIIHVHRAVGLEFVQQAGIQCHLFAQKPDCRRNRPHPLQQHVQCAAGEKSSAYLINAGVSYDKDFSFRTKQVRILDNSPLYDSNN